MGVGSPLLPQPLELVPLLPLQPRQHRLHRLDGPLPAVQLPLRRERQQRLADLLHGLLSRLPGVQRRTGLLPLPDRLGGVAGARPALAVLPGDLLVRFFGLAPGALRLGLRLAQGAAALAQGVEVVQLVADGLALVLLAALVDAGEAVLQALAAVADEVLQGGQLPQFLGPLLAVPAGRQPAAQPTLAVWLHHHQHWLLSEEDLITGAVANARPGVLVADRQQRPGAEAGLVAVPAQLGDAGGVLT